MPVTDLLERWFLSQADRMVARGRRPRPPERDLAAVRVVAHRGIYDNREVFENTPAAFEAFQRAGGWGIELDIRWTRDGVPVVAHDPDGGRLFGLPQPIAAMDLDTLRRRLPLVPTLADVLARFGGRMHLMLEIKALPTDAADRWRDVLRTHLAPLAPGRDYHLLSLDPGLLARLEFTPPEACIPIARARPRRIIDMAMRYGWGGLSGHYAILRRRHIALLHHRGLRIGTGFVNSANCLYRETARGVDWLFSDRPLALQRLLPSLADPGSRADAPAAGSSTR